MKKLLIFILMIFLVSVEMSCSTKSLVKTEKDDFSDVVNLTDTPPVFSRGNSNAWIVEHIKYPLEMVKIRGKGISMVRFIIDEKGRVTHPEVIRSSGYKALDMEAVRVISQMPPWKPGMIDGKAVRAYFFLPIKFELR